ncbi:MAG: hypothetical protein P4N59_16730 [Negativicutes bacterium]|nr:hypothetical protein [Negativicutes bacterium]
MRTKEEYYESVLKNREIASDPKNLRCSCPNVKCEWHGRCRECVALHRYYQDHVPACFHPLLRDKLKDLIKVVELETVEKEKTAEEYRDYAREQDKLRLTRPL